MIDIQPADAIFSLKPGLYGDVADALYFAIDAASNSRLSQLNRSPAHCRAAMNGEWSDTPALRFGSAAHAAVLQPEVYRRDYVHFDGDLRSKVNKERYEMLCEKHGERHVMRGDDPHVIAGMQAVLNEHRAARTILNLDGPTEVVALWEHEETGLLCKMKVDKYAIAAGVLADYKTTDDARPDEFSRSLQKWGYHRQGAFYIMGMRALGIDMKDFVLIAQEKSPPYAVSVMRISDAALLQGRDEVTELLSRYAECRQSECWPAYDDSEIVDIDLPVWYYNKVIGEMA